jgi:hypothetical protein
MAAAEFRFYEELNDFLAAQHRKRAVRRDCPAEATVKHVIEAFGVPHTEVELILANGASVDFSYRVREGDRVSVYPKFERLDITPLLKVRERPLRELRFIADAHLGALARRLRMLGFDVLYRNSYDDAEVARIARDEGRVVLTRDRNLLMHRAITHGSYIHATEPRRQLAEVLIHLDLHRAIRPFTRCLRCNEPLQPVDKSTIAERIPPTTRRYYDEYWQCTGCEHIYWQGSHWRRMQAQVEALVGADGAG